MNCEHAQHWMMMISDDLSEARRDLPARTGEPAAFLRARIAEDEAILGWLQRSGHAVGGSNHAPALGYSIGEPAQAV
jgi:hypothetical protein